MTQAELFAKFDTYFIANNNKFIDFDGYYGAQCVDLVQKWSQYIGGPRFYGDYAYEIYGQYPTFYTSIPNGATNVPQKGDIVIWSIGYNGYAGHTGIATGKGSSVGNANDWFECFEQNDPTGSVSHLRSYNFNYITGWLRPKITVITDPYIEKAKTLKTAVDRLKSESDTQYSGNKEQYYKDTIAKAKKIADTGTL